jgi:hypothetical protein
MIDAIISKQETHMFKSKSYIFVVILGILSLAFGACSQSPEQAYTAAPVEVPNEGSPGDFINVILEVDSTQPCKLVLTMTHKTGIDNYLNPYTSEKLTYPNSDGNVVFHEKIPNDTNPGDYVLKVFQMKKNGDTKGTEIFSQTFIVR